MNGEIDEIDVCVAVGIEIEFNERRLNPDICASVSDWDCRRCVYQYSALFTRAMVLEIYTVLRSCVNRWNTQTLRWKAKKGRVP
jgi:hypothetical protein